MHRDMDDDDLLTLVRPRYRITDEVTRYVVRIARALEQRADELRRRLAFGLRVWAPRLVRGAEELGLRFSRWADDIDQSLRRQGKLPSPRPSRTTPRYHPSRRFG